MRGILIAEGPGWYGIGPLRTGLFPGFSFGVVRLSWARGTLLDAFKAAVSKI